MEQGRSSEGNASSASQEFPPILWNITARHLSLSLPTAIQSTPSQPTS